MKALTLMLLLLVSCSFGGSTLKLNDAKKTRAENCQKLCKKEHYNIKFIKKDGNIEDYKIHVQSFNEKIVCECDF